MTHAISVPTPFNDISELAESFASRVDEERVMLPHYEDIPEGEIVRFEVTFGDGAPALSGSGRCSASYDNGEDREPEHRFDVVLEQLELDEMAQVYFERVLVVRQQQQGGGEPATGEIPVAEELPAEPMYAEPVDVEPAYTPAEEPVSDETVAFDDMPSEPQPVQVEDSGSFDAGLSGDLAQVTDSGETALPSRKRKQKEPERLEPPVEAIYALPPPVAPGMLPTPHGNGATLTRRGVDATWSPTPMERPDPSPSTGFFQYGIGVLPRPAAPPRPEIDPAMRVAPAPRPGDPPVQYDEAVYGADETMQVETSDEDY